jgi:hypothetical protein
MRQHTITDEYRPFASSVKNAITNKYRPFTGSANSIRRLITIPAESEER